MSTETLTQPPIIWTIAGSDSGGGAGIQADVATIQAMGGHPCTVITALTAQNSQGVQAVDPVAPDILEAQIKSLAHDLPPKAIKIGLLSTPWQIHWLAAQIADWRIQWPNTPVVLDPVLVATSGDSLTRESTVEAIQGLLSQIDLLTPNLSELSALTGQSCDTLEAAEMAARHLVDAGCSAVLVKGGHSAELADRIQDSLVTASRIWRFSQPRLTTDHTHGTGCTLSSALATALAQDYPLEDAVVLASRYLHNGLRQAYATGQGAGTLRRWQPEPEPATRGYPSVQIAPPSGTEPVSGFMACTWQPLGLYPVLPDSQWVLRALKTGVKTVQLRIKDPDHPRLTEEIAAAVQLGREYGAQVFINDHWALAIELGAYGVHLGQEDLDTADLQAIQGAGLRLGLSTHGYAELLRAVSYKPSYIALGHLFPTQTKDMPSKPQGLGRLARYQAIVDAHGIASLAIGGITLDRVEAIRACGTDSVAVVTAITRADDPEATIRQFQEALQ